VARLIVFSIRLFLASEIFLFTSTFQNSLKFAFVHSRPKLLLKYYLEFHRDAVWEVESGGPKQPSIISTRFYLSWSLAAG